MRKITLVVFGQLLAVALVAGAQTANTGVGVSGSAGYGSAGHASPGIVYPAPSPRPVPVPDGEDTGFLQFNNLTVQSVSPVNIPAEIVATNGIYPLPMMEKENMMMGAPSAVGTAPSAAPARPQSIKCYKFESESDASGISVTCPAPPVPPAAVSTSTATAPTTNAPGMARPMMYPYYGSYRIKVDASTRLLLRDRTPASLSNFSAGDQINVFGFYNSDGSIQAYLVRNLSKPVQREFIQLNNADLVSVSGTAAPTTLVVVQRPNYPCYGFDESGGAKRDIACPLGMQSLMSNSAAGNASVPPSIASIWNMVRKYEVRVDAQTIIITRTRAQLSLANLKVGDQLNIYGETSDNGQTIDADIVRDLSQPPAVSDYGGTVTQVNADGSFIIQSDDGRAITVQSPIQVGARVKLTGFLDTLSSILSQVSNIVIGSGQFPALRIKGIEPMPAGSGGRPNTQN